MNTSKPAAPTASKNKVHMHSSSRHPGAKTALSRGRRAGAALLALGLAACGLLPSQGPAPVESRNPVVTPVPPGEPTAGTIERPHARWVPARYADLPGWSADRAAAFFPALRLGCARPAEGWARLCSQARDFTPADDASARQWLEQRLQVLRVESPGGDATGLATGYFEPLVAARRRPTARFNVPLYAPPADLGRRKPWWTRQQLDTQPAAQAALRGREIAWVDDPLDALMLQVQGSGRLQLTEPDGTVQLLRLAYAGSNDQPYRSVGRWLIDQGELQPGEASWPAIKDWARRHPQRLTEMLAQNPRLVFFREEPLPDPTLGPKGAQGVPLTPGRSIAVDPLSIPYGTPVWLDSTEPLSAQPLQRLVMAQDTGSAIVGAVRADYFWGWGNEAEAQAGRMKQPLRAWVLWPRS